MKGIWKEKQFQVFRWKYLEASREEKSELLDQLCGVLGVHRKHAIRALKLRTPGRKPEGRKRGPKSPYAGAEFRATLHLVWERMAFISAKLMKKALPEWLPAIEKRQGRISSPTREKLLRISAASIDRILKPYKGVNRSLTRPGSILRNEIQIRGGVWDEKVPGYVEADTVAHCGNSTAGDFIWSLTVHDIATHWTECRSTWNKGAFGIVEQLRNVEKSLPFALLGFDCDNGSEFLNHHLVRYFAETKPKTFAFTRSRPYHKNDNAHVEQRNWSHPRRLFGRVRIASIELVSLMNDLYANEFSLLRNHFFPTQKLSEKIMLKSRFKRLYGEPMTPYERVIQSPHTDPETKQRLIDLHSSLDPIELNYKINSKLEKIERLRKQATYVTPSNAIA